MDILDCMVWISLFMLAHISYILHKQLKIQKNEINKIIKELVLKRDKVVLSDPNELNNRD